MAVFLLAKEAATAFGRIPPTAKQPQYRDIAK
jgi:hypothetical protein